MKLLKSLQKTIGSSYTRYKGCQVERRGGRYYALGKPHKSAPAARAHIDRALKDLSAQLT